MAENEGTADANAIVCLDGDNNRVESIIGRQYSDHPQYHPLVAALQSRSYGGNLAKKKEVLLLFLPSKLDDVKRYCRDQDLYNHYFRHLLDHLHRHSLKPSDISKYFKTDFVAEGLSQLFVLNEWNKALPIPPTRTLRGRDNPSINTKKAFASLSRYLGPVLKKYQEDQAKKKKSSTKSKVNMQQNGIRIQDTKTYNPNFIDGEGCPSCDHFHCQPVNTPEEVDQAQQEKDRAFQQRMTAWLAKPVKDRTGKPRKPQSVAIEFACFCYKLHCGYRDDGGNCPACQAAVVGGESMVYV